MYQIEQFGLEGVDSVADLTVPQYRFLVYARQERQRREKQKYEQ
ncbi:MAG: hypothetical protein SV760_03510 [Halobacteria archaeon]|nr:hypothetical protein [Halobacteria archaeon]